MIYTLLDMTQAILRAMDSDQVNSVSDTVESLQVAETIREVFYDMAAELQLPEHETIFQLNASGSSLKPTLMSIPSNVTKLRSVKYNKQADADSYPDYTPIHYIGFDDFLERQQSLRELTADVGSMNVTYNSETYPVIYATDVDPSYYTTADDQQLLFNSYDSTKDSTLQKVKTLCLGVTYPTFTLTDTFTPDIDPTQFPFLLQKAKVRCFNELKQQVNQEAVAEARRQKIVIQNRKTKTEDVAEVLKQPRYGRP